MLIINNKLHTGPAMSLSSTPQTFMIKLIISVYIYICIFIYMHIFIHFNPKQRLLVIYLLQADKIELV